jgi:hypothetical protein
MQFLIHAAGIKNSLVQYSLSFPMKPVFGEILLNIGHCDKSRWGGFIYSLKEFIAQ